MDKMIEAHKAVFGFEIIDGKIRPPKYTLPKAVKERIRYIGEEAENGMTFLGCLNCILAYDEEKSRKEFLLGSSKEWLPLTDEAKRWFDETGTPGEMLVAIELLYGLRNEE
ncbi:hypothetical protein [Enterococcus sp. DIV0800]|uniref:hypothetical protein n=1 Tax=unclassified Enterococcus TaxID=2608891 RepID=UPI003D2FE0E2